MANIRLFYPNNIYADSFLELNDSDYHYLINVMKVKVGQEIKVFNSTDGEWVAKVSVGKINKIGLVPLRVLHNKINKSNVTLAFSLLKRLNNNLVIQKATELNVKEITPIICDRTIVRKCSISKYQIIAKEAAEQCGRIDIPKINETVDLKSLIYKRKNSTVIICSNHDDSLTMQQLQNNINNNQENILVIGPECGFSDEEMKYFSSLSNLYFLNLGEFTLRAETAVIVALFALQQLMKRCNVT